MCPVRLASPSLSRTSATRRAKAFSKQGLLLPRRRSHVTGGATVQSFTNRPLVSLWPEGAWESRLTRIYRLCAGSRGAQGRACTGFRDLQNREKTGAALRRRSSVWSVKAGLPTPKNQSLSTLSIPRPEETGSAPPSGRGEPPAIPRVRHAATTLSSLARPGRGNTHDTNDPRFLKVWRPQGSDFPTSPFAQVKLIF